MSQILNQFTGRIDRFLETAFSNQYVYGAVVTFLVFYAALAAPALPPMIAGLFDSFLFKLLVIFGILVLLRYSPAVAILVAVGLVLSLQALNRYKLFGFMNVASMQPADQAVATDAHVDEEVMGAPVGITSESIEDKATVEPTISVQEPVMVGQPMESDPSLPMASVCGEEEDGPSGYAGMQIGADYATCDN